MKINNSNKHNDEANITPGLPSLKTLTNKKDNGILIAAIIK